MKIDHLMYAVLDLEEGINQIEQLTGVRADYGGPHPGMGTRNALLSLGDAVYLEIIAPDPDQKEGKVDLGEELRNLRQPLLRTWAASANDLEEVANNLTGMGLKAGSIINMSRSLPSGNQLQWQLLFASGHNYGNLVPFFIDWMGSPHPALTSPKGVVLESLKLISPEAEGLGTLVRGFDLDVEVCEIDEASENRETKIEAKLMTPKGSVVLS